MKKLTTFLCSMAFALSGVCLAVSKSEPPQLPGNMVAYAEPMKPIPAPFFLNQSNTEKEAKKDTVFTQVVKHDTVQVTNTKFKYVVKVRAEAKAETPYLPAFSITIPKGSWETSHDSTNVVSE